MHFDEEFYGINDFPNKLKRRKEKKGGTQRGSEDLFVQGLPLTAGHLHVDYSGCPAPVPHTLQGKSLFLSLFFV